MLTLVPEIAQSIAHFLTEHTLFLCLSEREDVDRPALSKLPRPDLLKCLRQLFSWSSTCKAVDGWLLEGTWRRIAEQLLPAQGDLKRMPSLALRMRIGELFDSDLSGYGRSKRHIPGVCPIRATRTSYVLYCPRTRDFTYMEGRKLENLCPGTTKAGACPFKPRAHVACKVHMDVLFRIVNGRPLVFDQYRQCVTFYTHEQRVRNRRLALAAIDARIQPIGERPLSNQDVLDICVRVV